MRPNSLAGTVSGLPFINGLITELRRRRSANEELSKKFDFLKKLHPLKSKEIREGARSLLTFYPGDLDRT